jgi:hypothetical protein
MGILGPVLGRQKIRYAIPLVIGIVSSVAVSIIHYGILYYSSKLPNGYGDHIVAEVVGLAMGYALIILPGALFAVRINNRMFEAQSKHRARGKDDERNY